MNPVEIIKSGLRQGVPVGGAALPHPASMPQDEDPVTGMTTNQWLERNRKKLELADDSQHWGMAPRGEAQSVKQPTVPGYNAFVEYIQDVIGGWNR